METDPKRNRTRLYILAILLVLVVDALYTFPYVLNWRTIGGARLPPFQSDDIYYYLNVSHGAASSDVVNPWFGNAVSASDVPHLRFPLAFRLFHILEQALPGRDALAVFLWNLFWTTAIAIAALVTASSLSMRRFTPVWMASVFLMLLVNVPSLLMGAYRWIRAGHASVLFLQLPFYRSFYPQIAIPFLLAHVCLQVRMVRDRRWTWCLLLIAIQFLTFVAFPYAALLMLGATALSVLLELLFGRRPDWLRTAIYFGVSMLFDGAFVIRSAAGQSTAIRLGFHGPIPDRSLVLISTVLLAAAVVTLFLERRSNGPDATAVSIALALVLITWTGDLFVSDALGISVHMAYLYPVIFAILLSRCLSLAAQSIPPRAAILLACVFLVHGATASAASGIASLETSREQRDLLKLLNDRSVGPLDLVVVPTYSSEPSEPEGEWIPLVTGSRVLFDPDAQPFVARANGEIYWFRLAVQLHLMGRGVAFVEHAGPAFVGPMNATELSGPNGPEIVETTKRALADEMNAIESDPKRVCGLFRPFARVVVLERSNAPVFNRKRLAECLKLDSSSREGAWTLSLAQSRLR